MPKITIEVDVTEKQLNAINETAISDGYENVQEWWQERLQLEVRETLRRKNIQTTYEAVATKEQVLTDRIDTLVNVLSTWVEKVNSSAPTCNGNCGINYCDDNGCVDRKRVLVEPELVAKGTF